MSQVKSLKDVHLTSITITEAGFQQTEITMSEILMHYKASTEQEKIYIVSASYETSI